MEQADQNTPISDDQIAEVSINAMFGPNSFSTFRLKGVMEKYSIYLLIDTGSIHTFLDESVAHKLGIHLQATSPLVVDIADGNQLCSRVYSPHFVWKIQGHEFRTDVRILPLRAYGNWSGLASTTQSSQFDFSKMQLTITNDHQPLTLKAASNLVEL